MASKSFSIGNKTIKYDGETIAIPKEIDNVKSKFFGNKSLKECIFIGIAIGVFYLVYRACGKIAFLKEWDMALAMVAACIPLAIGFIKISTFTLTDYVLIFRSNTMLSRPIRYNNIKNEYERLEQIYHAKNGKKKKQKDKRKSSYKLTLIK